jgi:hypothetical protein
MVDVDRSGPAGDHPLEEVLDGRFPEALCRTTWAAMCRRSSAPGLKIPLTYVDPTPGAFRYIACEVIAGNVPQVLTVYRDGRFVTPAEYSTDTVTLSGVHLPARHLREGASR